MRWTLKPRDKFGEIREEFKGNPVHRACVDKWSSGQNEYYSVDVRIVWSEKLGLTLKHDFGSGVEAVRKAERVARAINKAGTINPDLWEKDFYPSVKYIGNHSD